MWFPMTGSRATSLHAPRRSNSATIATQSRWRPLRRSAARLSSAVRLSVLSDSSADRSSIKAFAGSTEPGTLNDRTHRSLSSLRISRSGQFLRRSCTLVPHAVARLLRQASSSAVVSRGTAASISARKSSTQLWSKCQSIPAGGYGSIFGSQCRSSGSSCSFGISAPPTSTTRTSGGSAANRLDWVMTASLRTQSTLGFCARV